MSSKQTENSRPDSTTRKPYEPPTVIRYGALRDLTHGPAGTLPDPSGKTGSQV